MTARVIVHPRCLNGPASGALAATLAAHGLRTGEVAIGPPSEKGYCDLVELVSRQDGILTLQRMDGTTFKYDASGIEQGPSAA